MDDTYRFEADKTLLEHIEKGDAVEITRQGAVVARVVPLTPNYDPAEARAAVERIRKRSKGVTLGGLKITDLIHEGHKY
jgi:antitoxin (DNA-binding transcriptional repressor) of toxin-antitoxin stability system